LRFRYFNRDVECIRTFFRRRFRYESAIYPKFKSTVGNGSKDGFRLDVVVEASGFGRREMKVLEQVLGLYVYVNCGLALTSAVHGIGQRESV
jgi:RIO kinase 2